MNTSYIFSDENKAFNENNHQHQSILNNGFNRKVKFENQTFSPWPPTYVTPRCIQNNDLQNNTIQAQYTTRRAYMATYKRALPKTAQFDKWRKEQRMELNLRPTAWRTLFCIFGTQFFKVARTRWAPLKKNLNSTPSQRGHNPTECPFLATQFVSFAQWAVLGNSDTNTWLS